MLMLMLWHLAPVLMGAAVTGHLVDACECALTVTLATRVAVKRSVEMGGRHRQQPEATD